MPQYFIKEKLQSGTRTQIKGRDCYHLTRVRRVKLSDKLLVRSTDGEQYSAIITKIDDRFLEIEVLELVAKEEQKAELTVGLSLLKGKNFELALQKVVELGVDTIVPIITERTVADVKGKTEAKLKRWEMIANEAAKQCLRSDLPLLKEPETYQQFIEESMESLKLIAHPDQEVELLSDVLTKEEQKESIAVAIGPEGGFSAAELESAIKNSWRVVNVGTTHYRAETAAIVIPALILYEITKK